MGDYEEFKDKIYALTKIDLHSYKEKQMRRRIDSLIQKCKLNNYNDYVELLKSDNEKLEEFITYLTINVSEFYRNPDQWILLENEMLPYLFDTFGNEITVWSAACSTGDEPYTLAMLLAKFVPLDKIHIIATDLDKQVLQQAQLGMYRDKSLKGLPNEFLNKYFTQVGNSNYQICDEIKNCVEFRHHDLLKDEYPQGINMIVCRNVTIYFTEEAKKNIYKKFNAALKDNGLLFVGSTEQIIAPKEYGFTSFKSFFYKK